MLLLLLMTYDLPGAHRVRLTHQRYAYYLLLVWGVRACHVLHAHTTYDLPGMHHVCRSGRRAMCTTYCWVLDCHILLTKYYLLLDTQYLLPVRISCVGHGEGCGHYPPLATDYLPHTTTTTTHYARLLSLIHI